MQRRIPSWVYPLLHRGVALVQELLNRTRVCGSEAWLDVQASHNQEYVQRRPARPLTGGPYTSAKLALGPGPPSPFISWIGLWFCLGEAFSSGGPSNTNCRGGNS